MLALGGFLGRGDGIEGGVGRVASRCVEDVFVVFGRWMRLVDRILTSARVYVVIVLLSHGLQVNVLSYHARHKQLPARFFNQGQQ